MSRMFRQGGSDSSQSADNAMLESLLQKREGEVRAAFEVFDPNRTGYITLAGLLSALQSLGLRPDNAEIQDVIKHYEFEKSERISFQSFYALMNGEENIVQRALTGNLAIPNFREFCDQLVALYDECSGISDGQNAQYIPQLAKIDPSLWGISLVTIDAQFFEHGDTQIDFCLQSVSKPLMYCLACEQRGIEKVHQHIGYEPSGVAFNAFTLNWEDKPHNPLINSGAITTCSLIDREVNRGERFANVLSFLADLAGGHKMGFNQPVYLSEKDTADRNYALAYFMRGAGVFEENCDIDDTLEFYMQACSIECNCSVLACMGGTLANGGVSPISKMRVVSPKVVRNCLTLMYSCGMYDYSGEWGFRVSLPAKSGVSGALLIVIPNVCGLATYSPPLDRRGNSVRGVRFCERLTQIYSFGIFDQLVMGVSTKLDPTISNGPSLPPPASHAVEPLALQAAQMEIHGHPNDHNEGANHEQDSDYGPQAHDQSQMSSGQSTPQFGTGKIPNGNVYESSPASRQSATSSQYRR